MKSISPVCAFVMWLLESLKLDMWLTFVTRVHHCSGGMAMGLSSLKASALPLHSGLSCTCDGGWERRESWGWSQGSGPVLRLSTQDCRALCSCVCLFCQVAGLSGLWLALPGLLSKALVSGSPAQALASWWGWAIFQSGGEHVPIQRLCQHPGYIQGHVSNLQMNQLLCNFWALALRVALAVISGMWKWTCTCPSENEGMEYGH